MQINKSLQSSLSAYIRQTTCSLPQLVRLLRGQRALKDPPNPALGTTLHSDPRWASLTQRGVIPPLLALPRRQKGKPPDNHGSLHPHLAQVSALIREGQDQGRYLVVDLDILNIWPEVFCSPFGTVPKDATTEVELPSSVNDLLKMASQPCHQPVTGGKIRLIHDLSWPLNASINSCTDGSQLPVIQYHGPTAVATTILQLQDRFPGVPIHMMTGDVSSAFRHIPIHEDFVHLFAAALPEENALIIDLSCPFGWSGSPAFYFLAATEILRIHGATSPTWPQQPTPARFPFSALAWCDDHIGVEPDLGSRLAEADISLRGAMVSVLGPLAINDKKFTPFFQHGKVLGLDWDLQQFTLGLPTEKLSRGVARIASVLKDDAVSRSRADRLMGSLRYLSLCCVSARSFVGSLSRRLGSIHRFKRHLLTPADRADLKWAACTLLSGELTSVSLRIFTKSQPVDYHLFMDASDLGLCALNPRLQSYFTISFSAEERLAIVEEHPDWHINIRELTSVILSVLAWGPFWRKRENCARLHIQCYIDNTSAVAWVNRRAAPTHAGQQLLRLLAYLEILYHLHVTATHIPGTLNVLADAGSRLSISKFATQFANIVSAWRQVSILMPWRKPLELWEQLSETQHSLQQQSRGMLAPGVSGLHGADDFIDLDGSRDPSAHKLLSLPSLLASQLDLGSTADEKATLEAQF